MFGENCPKCGKKIEIVGYTRVGEHGKRIYGCDCGVYYERPSKREKAIMAGVKLPSGEEVLEEVRRRRGEVASERR